MDVHHERRGIVEQRLQCRGEIGTANDGGVDHHCICIERSYRQHAVGELARHRVGADQCLRCTAVPFVDEDWACASVRRQRRRERIVRHKEQAFADLGVSQALATRVPGPGVSDVSGPAAPAQNRRLVRADRVEEELCSHVQLTLDSGFS